LDFARTGLAFAVTGDAHEVDGHVAVQSAGEVGHEERGALEDADHVQLAGGVIGRNLFAQFAQARLDLLGGNENAQFRIGHGAYHYPTAARAHGAQVKRPRARHTSGLASGRGWQNVKELRQYGWLRTAPRELTAGNLAAPVSFAAYLCCFG